MGRIGILSATLWATSWLAGAAAQDVPAVPPPPSPSESDLRRVQDEHEGEIDFCLVRERSLHPHAHGIVAVSLGIDAAGHAVDAAVTSSTFPEPGVVAACLLAAVGRWTFPSPSDVTARHQLLFVLGMAAEAERPVRVPPTRRSGPHVTWQIVGVPVDWGTSEEWAIEIARSLERRRTELSACIAETAAREGSPADVVLEVDAYHPGRLRRDDVRVLHSSWPNPDAALRCLWREIERVEVREMPTHSRVHWLFSVR